MATATEPTKGQQLIERSDAALSELQRALAAGRSERLTAYLGQMARFHNYSFGNCMLIAIQCPTATQVAGYERWKELGRQVRKGERGIGILAPFTRKVTDDETGEEGRRVIGFRAAHVFDIAQTDVIEGGPWTELGGMSGDVGDAIGCIEVAIASRGCSLLYVPAPAGDPGAQGANILGGRIEIKTGLSDAERLRVLAHEFAHELLHRNGDTVAQTKRERETEAEAVAYVVCASVGLANEISADYIALHGGDVQALARSLQRIQKAANAILIAMADAPTLSMAA